MPGPTRKWYEIKAKDTNTAEILIYEEIGESFWGGGVSAKQFAEDLKALGAVTRINLRINSPGGSVHDGFAIYNQLVRHPARIETDIDGMALSAASVVALAGNEVRMAANALFMIHNPYGFVLGEAAEMRKMAETLDKVRENIAGVYVSRTAQPPEQVSAWMDAESWFTADEAQEHGFIDAITANQVVQNYFDLGRYQRVPPQLLAHRQARQHYQVKLSHMQQIAAQRRKERRGS